MWVWIMVVGEAMVVVRRRGGGSRRLREEFVAAWKGGIRCV